MFDFDGRVVGKFRKLAMQRSDQRNSVPDAIKEVRIAKSNVFRTSIHLTANISENHFERHDAKRPVVHRNNRAMAAKMFASARGLRVTGNSRRAIRKLKRRITIERRQTLSIGN